MPVSQAGFFMARRREEGEAKRAARARAEALFKPPATEGEEAATEGEEEALVVEPAADPVIAADVPARRGGRPRKLPQF